MMLNNTTPNKTVSESCLKIYLSSVVSMISLLVEREIFAQIIFPYQFVGSHFLIGARKNQLAILNNIGPVYNRKRRSGIVVSQQNAEASFAQHANQFLNVLNRNRVNAGKGLV